MRILKAAFLAALLGMALSCAGAKVPLAVGFLPQELKTAVAPGGGLLAEAVGAELVSRGFIVIDAAQMADIMAREKLAENVVSDRNGLAVLKENGIDAVMIVKPSMGQDGRPNSADVRVTNTSTGMIIAEIGWKNGWGGLSGTIANKQMRSKIAEAAKQITDALLKRKSGGSPNRWA